MKYAEIKISFITLVLVLMSSLNGYTTPITIMNSGFESNVLADGRSISAVTDWTRISPYAGTWNPSTSMFASGAPEGNNVLYLNGSSISQTLSETLASGITYTLMVDVGHRADNSWDSNFTISLFAGSNVLVSQTGGFDPGLGQFGTLSLSYTSGTDYIGDLLGISISNSKSQTNFDNVRLDATGNTPLLSRGVAPVPEPGTLVLLGAGLFGLAVFGKRRMSRS